jgi:hypothetical protein
VPCDERSHKRLLIGKVLVERSNAHTRYGSDAICAGPRISIAHQNASSGIQYRLDGHFRPLLRGGFSGICSVELGHILKFRMRVDNVSKSSHILYRSSTIKNVSLFNAFKRRDGAALFEFRKQKQELYNGNEVYQSCGTVFGNGSCG